MLEGTVPGTPAGKVAAFAVLLLILLPLGALPSVGADGSASLTISGSIGPSPGITADFSGAPRSGLGPLTVQFTDRSSGNPTAWTWDLDGDGSVDNTAKNPTFVYHHAGSYTITLTASTAAESDAEMKPGYIAVSEPGALARVQALEGYTNAIHAHWWAGWILSLHLNLADRMISRGNHRAAVAQMNVFLHQVDFFEHFHLVTTWDAEYLREEARTIIRELLRG